MKYNTQNAKIASITEETLVLGIDVGSETHYVRAFDWRNYEYSKTPLAFGNDKAGFLTFKAWVEGFKRKTWEDSCDSGDGTDRTLLVQPWKVPAGQRDETGSCKSASCKEIEGDG